MKIIKAIILYITILCVVLFICTIDMLETWKDILLSIMCVVGMCITCCNVIEEDDLKTLLFSDKFEKLLKNE